MSRTSGRAADRVVPKENGPLPRIETRARAVFGGKNRPSSANLLALDVASDERKQLTREREHVFLGKTAGTKLSVDVLRENFDRTRVSFGTGGDGRRLRHN